MLVASKKELSKIVFEIQTMYKNRRKLKGKIRQLDINSVDTLNLSQ